MPMITKRAWRRVLTAAAVALFTGCAAPPQKPVDIGPIVFPKPPDPPRFVFEQTLLGTASVRQLSDRDRLQTLLTGTAVAEGIGFAKPFDVAVREGRVHVTDTVHRSVLVMDFPNSKGFVIGDRGDDGDLFKPLGIGLDSAGAIYVVDATMKAVQIYDKDGNFQRRIDMSGFSSRPSGLDVSPDGSMLYVVDTGGVDSDMHRVMLIDAASGQLVRAIGTRGTNDGEFNLPRDVKVGLNGLIYVTDGGNFRVQAFTQDGQFVRAWGQPGRRLGQFSRPKGISTDKEGNLYVVDAAFGNFQIFNPEGQLLMFVGDRSTVPEPAKYMLPAGIDVDEDGRVYMVDQFFRKLDVYRPIVLDESAGWLARKDTRGE